MRRFIRRTSFFFLILLCLAVVADVVISAGLRRTERGHFYTMNALMRQKMDADVVILGNSRAACSYHPFYLDSVLAVNSRNLGVSGQPFGVSWLRWRLYERNNRPPELLIINMDYRELDIVTNGFEREQYYPYMRDTLVRPYLDLYGFSWLDKYMPMYRYRGDYKLMAIGLMEAFHLRHDTKGDSYKGYSIDEENWHGRKLASVLRQGKVTGTCNPQAVRLVSDVIRRAQESGTAVLLVYAPMFSVLKENLEETEPMAAYQELSVQYGIPILDFSRMSFCADTLYFKDANHINRKGAAAFSRALAQAIDSLGILNRHRESIPESVK